MCSDISLLLPCLPPPVQCSYSMGLTVYPAHPICYADSGARGKKPLYTTLPPWQSSPSPFLIVCTHVFNVDPTSTAWILPSPCHHLSVMYPLAPLLSLAFPPKVLVYPHLSFPMPPFILHCPATQCLFFHFMPPPYNVLTPKCDYFFLDSHWTHWGAHVL